ncbi:MAG TPA: HAMP domain-containing protein, partial [Cellvibrio sp.]|nr:HAMP domain-containing protein [Cellvibrio sp.]
MFLFNRIAFYNIRAALLVFVLLPFLITIVATGWYGLYRLEASAKAAMEEEIELLARAIRLPLSHALQHGHSGTLQRSVTSIFDIDKVYAVYVYDKDGRRISTSGSSKARVQDREAVDLANKGDEQGEFDKVGGEEVFSYFLPLTDSGENSIGLLQVTRRGSDFSRRVDEFRANAIAMLVLSTLLVTGLIWVGYQRAVGRHIHRMREDMELIAAGDLQHRVAVDGPSEIRFLAQGFNQMLDSIVASEQELRERREREYELQSRLQQTEKLAAIGRFAAGVAHELGTPLS